MDTQFTQEKCINWILIGIAGLLIYYLVFSDSGMGLFEGLENVNPAPITFNPSPNTDDNSNGIGGQASVSLKDLLPENPQATKFGAENPVQNELMDQNFLSAGFHVGINTMGTTKNNANYDIRALPEITIPQGFASPWNVASNLGERDSKRPLNIGNFDLEAN